jgi:hypothetical protein
MGFKVKSKDLRMLAQVSVVQTGPSLTLRSEDISLDFDMDRTNNIR